MVGTVRQLPRSSPLENRISVRTLSLIRDQGRQATRHELRRALQDNGGRIHLLPIHQRNLARIDARPSPIALDTLNNESDFSRIVHLCAAVLDVHVDAGDVKPKDKVMHSRAENPIVNEPSALAPIEYDPSFVRNSQA